jgi:transcription initiation factor TFIID subunit 2
VLGQTAGPTTNWMGLDVLLKFYKERCFDPDLAQARPNDFTNLAEHYVNQAVIDAAARAREAVSDTSAPEVVDFLVDLMAFNNNMVNPWDDSDLRATILTALGSAIEEMRLACIVPAVWCLLVYCSLQSPIRAPYQQTCCGCFC